MSVALIDVILAGLAALFYGLWWGERGRRLAAERWRVYGTPEEPGPASVTRPAEATALSGQSPFSEETIERGAADLEAKMTSEGFQLSHQDYRALARSILEEANRP